MVSESYYQNHLETKMQRSFRFRPTIQNCTIFMAFLPQDMAFTISLLSFLNQQTILLIFDLLHVRRSDSNDYDHISLMH